MDTEIAETESNEDPPGQALSRGLIGRLCIPMPGPPINEVWPSEPFDFTPWLADNLTLLDILELGPLTLVGTEHKIPGTGRALDILAESHVGLVAIENQYGKADHDHLTRGLAYAVGLGAVALVVIAEDHLGEFRAVAGYLNDIADRSDADYRIRVYLVELGVESVADYLVPRLTLLERPNSWVEAVSDSIPSATFATIDDLLDSAPEPARSGFHSIVDWWRTNPVRSIRKSNNAAVLDRPHPTNPTKPLSHLLLNTNGTFTIQRGYLVECGAVDEDQTDAFDEFLRATFPSLAWTAKKYFLTGPGSPPIEAVMDFVEWLDEHKTP